MNLLQTAKKLAWLTSHPECRSHPFQVSMRVFQWEWHRMRGRPVFLPLSGFVIQARPSDGIGRLICYFRDGADELFAFMKTYLEPGMTFVDVGANIGSHTIHGARLVTSSGRVFSFEADPDTFELLRKNLSLNAIKNVKLYNQCVADKDGTVTFNISANSARSSMVRKGASQKTLPANTLDNLLRIRTPVDFLKIDVEGAEYLVLRGARQLFETGPPGVVVIEMSSCQEEIREFLLAHGYKLYRFDDMQSSLVEIESPSFNTYAIHDSVLDRIASRFRVVSGLGCQTAA